MPRRFSRRAKRGLRPAPTGRYGDGGSGKAFNAADAVGSAPATGGW